MSNDESHCDAKGKHWEKRGILFLKGGRGRSQIVGLDEGDRLSE